MARPSKYPQQLRERPVRMVIESKDDHETEAAAIRSISGKLVITSPESLRKWLRQGEVDGGVRPGKTTDDIVEIKALKKEVGELRRTTRAVTYCSEVLQRPGLTAPPHDIRCPEACENDP